MINALLLILAGYVCGSLPFGVWVAKSRGIDLTKVGSGSTGATNVYRCVGKKEGILVLFLDALKGWAPVTAAIWLDHGSMTWTIPLGGTTLNLPDIVPCLAGVMSMIGHSKSMFLKFGGGKSAATGLGTIIALNPLVGILMFASFLSLVYFTRLVSVASMGAAIIDPILMAVFKAPPSFIIYAAVGGLIVIVRHKSNIKRLLNGTEPRFGEKASGDAASTATAGNGAGSSTADSNGAANSTAASNTEPGGAATSNSAGQEKTSSDLAPP